MLRKNKKSNDEVAAQNQAASEAQYNADDLPPMSDTSAEEELYDTLHNWREQAKVRFAPALDGNANTQAEAIRCAGDLMMFLQQHIDSQNPEDEEKQND